MKKEIKKMVVVPALVNWHQVKAMEEAGHVFNSWNEYPTFTKPDFKFVKLKSNR